MASASSKWLFVLGVALLGPERAMAEDLPPLEQIQPAQGQETPETLLLWLLAPEPGQRAEAQVRLLPHAHEWLPPGFLAQVDHLALSAGNNEDERGYLREFLRLLTLHGTRVERLLAHPRLAELSQPEVDEGHRLVAAWRETGPGLALQATRYASRCAEGALPPTLLLRDWRLLRLREELKPLGGLALPALEHLLLTGTPEQRLAGIALTDALRLRPGRDALARLEDDVSEVPVYGDFNERIIRIIRSDAPNDPLPPKWEWLRLPMARYAQRLERNLSHDWADDFQDPAYLSAETRVAERVWLAPFPAEPHWTGPDVELRDELRGIGIALAGDEQAFWNQVRPRWRAWWRTHGQHLVANRPE
ncbi:hypothetical protein [Archangium primigenium]|uniref:hypothetical protein n=1 Tax=[Archangium] primigenium TaxID=2792470 RepID=UPI00195B53F4|nr:hypothetical protein [Archangium primigenium]MBM7116877.1 hypothetical protein [Archangium primigenium]